ncbi:MAG: zinc ribbon domain-containing protein [Spirochaetales bacterium]|nr:zinc ribbon domain-containing protein [Spirochaetales bacterium]
MAYKQCGYCNFQVAEEEKYCPNCGFKNSWNIKRKWELDKYNEESVTSIRKEGNLYRGLSLVFSGTFALSLSLCFLLFSLRGSFFLFMLSGFITLLSGFGASGFFIYYRTAFEFKNKRKNRYLINEEKMIHRRIKEIIEKKERIKNLQDRIQRSEGKDDLKRTFAILAESQDHLEQYENRFRTELKKIELIRWRNKFRPMVEEWHKSCYEKGERLLDELEMIIVEGKELLSSCTQDKSIFRGFHGQKIIKQMEGDLDFVLNLQKSLLNRQAQLSIQAIRPLETEQLYQKQAMLFKSYIEKSIEYINAHSFFEAFEELEDEYIRFQSEKDVLAE